MYLKLAKRSLFNNIFAALCCAATSIPVIFLFTMLFSIYSGAYNVMQQSKLFIDLDSAGITNVDSRYQIRKKLADYINEKILDYPRDDISLIMSVLSNYSVREVLEALKGSKGKIWVTLSGEADIIYKYKDKKDFQPKLAQIVQELKKKNLIKKVFNYKVFINPDSMDSSHAGIMGAFVGSLYTILVTLVCSFPIGVLAALWIGEYLAKSRFAQFLEVSINNLSSTPPIVFGILGLAFYINFLSLPRSSALVGGLTLAFMMFPLIVISTLQAIRSVPKSIKEAAFALGASKIEVVLHHVLPMSFPGILSGTILGIARILGESAPLLMIGMVAFVGSVPHSITDPANVFAVQIYIWATSADAAMTEKTSLLILMLLLLLFSLNYVVHLVQKRFRYEVH